MAIKIESTGLFENGNGKVTSSLELIRNAFSNCLQKSRFDKNEIDLILQVSSYKDHNLGEPAFATFVQNDLGINHVKNDSSPPRTLSFDLLNGGMGFLNSCQAAGAMFAADQAHTCAVVSGNVWALRLNPKSSCPPGFFSMGAAMVLEKSAKADSGFGSFLFKRFPEYREAYYSHLIFEEGRFSLIFKRAPDLEKIYLSAIARCIPEFLDREKTDLQAFDLILPPQISPGFISELAGQLGVSRSRFIDVTRKEGDLFTASLPAALDHAVAQGLARPGRKALIINVGAGLQVGVAAYVF